MRTVRRLLHTDVLRAVAFVALAFLSLFFFLDFVEELDNVGRGLYRVQHAALYCLLQLPGHFYELFPIAVLIGSIFAMARLAQSSEFTILRTGGLGPGRALRLLAVLGLGFGLVTFVVGDYVGPYFDAKAEALRGGLRGDAAKGGNSAWLKDRRMAAPGEEPPGERIDSINVGHVGAGGRLADVRIYEFSAEGEMLSRIAAERAQVENGAWLLSDVRITRWNLGPGGRLPADEALDSLRWTTQLSPAVVGAAVSPLRSMSTVDLYRYMSHLSDNEQAAQRQEIQFWKKALYPLACLVMVGLALPFAYLHARAGGVSVKVFGGILLGISFVLLSNVSTHLGLLRDWTPWFAAAAPSVLYLLLSLAAFSWLVRYR
jgi:lipopolysaccharide export system permease protein